MEGYTVREYEADLMHIRRALNETVEKLGGVHRNHGKYLEKIINDALNAPDLFAAKDFETLDADATYETDMLKGAYKCVKWIANNYGE